MDKSKMIRSSLWLIAASVVFGLGIVACSSSVGNGSTAGSATDSAAASSTGSYSVDVTWDGVASAKSLVGSRALPAGLSSVTVLPYSQAGVSILSDTTYAADSYKLTNSGGVWHGTISVNATGPAVFALTAYSSGTTVAYVGKGTLTISATNPNSIAIDTGLASLIAGAIQGQVPVLSAYVNTFAGAHGTYGLDTFPDTGTAVGTGFGTRTDATFPSPRGITTDGTNLFVTDYAAHTIKKIPIATGLVTVLAGAGTSGDAAGSAASAEFSSPSGITNDGTYLYVCSRDAIDRVSMADGTTVIYDGTPATPGATDGVGVASTYFVTPLGITYYGGYLYVADTGNSNIRRILLGTGDGIDSAGQSYTFTGPNASETVAWASDNTSAHIYAPINVPAAITTDGIHLYVANTGNGNIIQIKLDGSAEAEFASTGFTNPNGITTDGTYLYVSDASTNQIKKIEIANKAVSLVAGNVASTPENQDGLSSAARFNTPLGNIVTDGKNLYVADSANFTIRKIQ